MTKLLQANVDEFTLDRKGSGLADVEPGADTSEVGIYQIRDGKIMRPQIFHADWAAGAPQRRPDRPRRLGVSRLTY